VKNLRLILDSLKVQSDMNFNVLVSEDGESSKMKEFLADYKANYEINHATQVDEGWRKNKALNNAIRQAKGGYLIFIDGDCVLHHHFIREHKRHAEDNTILFGRRIKLGKQLSVQLAKAKSLKAFTSMFWLRYLFFFWDGSTFVEEALYINPNGPLKFMLKNKIKGLKGCNFSCHKKTLLAINGFDEDYQLPAVGEDTDLDWRFEKAGFRFKSVRHLAVQYHMHHEEGWTDVTENMALLKAKREKGEFICVNGIA